MKPLEEYSKEELIEIVNSLKRQKKFGLVWEDKPEKVVTECEQKLPVLEEVPEKGLTSNDNNGESTNLIIEGDNYHTLSVLNYTHPSSIDIIYIDPPYNTGNKDFAYNDKFVDKEDSFRHSKWLSFMNRRLILAKNLLKDDGLILISIDDNEQSQLKLLCDAIFGEQNFIDTFIWEKNPNPTFLNKYSRSSAEYIVCYARNKVSGLRELDGGIVASSETDAPLQNKGNPRRRILVKSGMARILFADQCIKAGNYGLVDLLNDITFENGKNTNDFIMEGTFRMTQETLYERITKGEQLLFKTTRMSPRLSYSANIMHSAPLKTLRGDKYGTTQIGNNDIKEIFGAIPFSYPKPTQLIKNIVSFKNLRDAVILDFFAGSGTTGQAVLELNREDGGNRKFILCTNNENNIAEDVTYPRIKTVVTGIRNDGTKYSDGISANVRYFKTDFVEKGQSLDETREKLVARATDIILIKEDTFKSVFEERDLKLYSNGKTFTAIVLDPFRMRECWDNIEKNNPEKLETHLYIFAYSSDVSAFTDEIPTDTLINWVSKPIPDGILKVYKKLFQ